MSEIVEDSQESAEISLELVQTSFGLNEKQFNCAERYLQHYDLVRAVKEAYGYDGQVVYNRTNQLRNNENFVTYLAARMKDRALPADAVLAELAMLATVDITDFLNDELLEETGQPMFDGKKAHRLGVMKAIRRIEYIPGGGVRFELYDRLRALEIIAKHLGLLKEPETRVENYVITVVRE